MGMLVLAFVSGFSFAFFAFVPFFEWLLHRHAMHTEKRWWLWNGLYRLHDRTHHIIFDHDKFYTKTVYQMNQSPSLKNGLSFNGWFMLGIMGTYGFGYFVALAPLAFLVDYQLVFAVFVGLLVGSNAFGFLQIRFHYWYHAADGFGYRVLARMPLLGRYFLYMVEHHRKHHEDTSKYLNTLVPTVDLVIHWFRTLFGVSARAMP